MGDVLVVDDDAGVRDFIGVALAAAGIPVRAEEDGARALARVAERPLAVILLDRDMKGRLRDGETMAAPPPPGV